MAPLLWFLFIFSTFLVTVSASICKISLPLNLIYYYLATRSVFISHEYDVCRCIVLDKVLCC